MTELKITAVSHRSSSSKHAMFVRNLILLTVFLQITSADVDSCETPNGQNGDCKPINNCPLLHSYFERAESFSASTATYLRRSLCGFEGTYPKVCCPLGSSVPVTDTIATSELLPSTGTCGMGVASKIYGGRVTEIDEHPWMALLEYKSRTGRLYFGCGGTLISKRYILTARHCLASNLQRVRLGEYDTETDPDVINFGMYEDRAPPVLKIDVEERILFESQDPSADIGLIRLKEEVQFSDFVKPICLPTTSDHLNKSYLGEKFIVAGWGTTEQKKRSNIKLQVQVPVRPLAECVAGLKSAFNAEITLNENQICAGGEKGKDSCNGDSGGPLMGLSNDANNHSHWYLIGVVSFGPNNPCGQENQPAVYVKVANYVPWIVKNLRP